MCWGRHGPGDRRGKGGWGAEDVATSHGEEEEKKDVLHGPVSDMIPRPPPLPGGGENQEPTCVPVGMWRADLGNGEEDMFVLAFVDVCGGTLC